jgi:hypothetical protein
VKDGLELRVLVLESLLVLPSELAFVIWCQLEDAMDDACHFRVHSMMLELCRSFEIVSLSELIVLLNMYFELINFATTFAMPLSDAL